MGLRIIIAYLIMSAAILFAVITAVGLIRFPDVYTRIHASAVVLTMSAVMLSIGVAIYVWEFYLSIKILLVGLIFLITNPLATHAIARASYRRKIAIPQVKSIDEYSGYLSRDQE
ncbi:MAG: monovalent cation/H(+) antiporter subunit G [Halanaerobiales bacterium]|nr:monovalent cation/H(+) antiporter subunit G [Halanaerobiales bacterium]